MDNLQLSDYTPSKPLMKEFNILNIYQLNIYQTLNFMFKTKQNTTPTIFQQRFRTINHKYPTKFSANNLLIPNQKRFSVIIYYRSFLSKYN